MNKKFSDKIKNGVSVQEMEDFARKYSIEVFSVVAIIIATISSIYDFFTSPGLTIVFTALGCILGVFFPVPTERGLKQLYSYMANQEKTTQMILGAVKIIVAIFIPFILFGVLGLLAGTSYHYYVRHSQIMEENKIHRHLSGEDEHD
jgi:hypothetical protein